MVHSDILKSSWRKKPTWYERQKAYWDKQPTTVSGILQGHGDTSHVELQVSRRFLADTFGVEPGQKLGRAFDVGAGIGRISKELLAAHFEPIDLLDQSRTQIDAAKANVPQAANFYCCGFQDFEFEHKYDCIWLQWFLMYLTDDDLVAMLSRCGSHLTPGGLVVVKENVYDS